MSGPLGIVIDVKDGVAKPANFGMIAAARKTGRPLVALVIDGGGMDLTASLGRHGVGTVVDIHLETPGWHPVVWSRSILDAMARFGITVLFGLTSGKGRDLLPRVAADLDAPLIMDCTDVDLDRGIARTSQYSGKTVATIAVEGTHAVFGIRPNAHAAAPDPCQAERISFSPGRVSTAGMRLVSHDTRAAGGTNLAEAEVIISGGRAMKNGENFHILFECADLLGAAVGASRPAVDAGWVPYAMQVGQTGAKVSPKVYIACGISGSVQHFAGMKSSGCIVAVNTDPNAAIVSACDYYIIADLFDVIPRLTQRLRQLTAVSDS